MNQQLYPQTTYPLIGDISSTPSSPNVTVVGIQTIPVVPGAADKQVLEYIGSTNSWTASNVPFNQSIQVNSLAMSDDYDIFVKNADLTVIVNSAYPANGKQVLVNGA